MKVREASFYDRFGVFYFLIVGIIGFWMLVRSIPSWTAYVLIFIGISGFIVDFIIVCKTYLRRRK